MFNKNKKGMTLIELLAVIAIIAVLLVILTPKIGNAFDKARYTGIQVDIRSYEIALKSYFMEAPPVETPFTMEYMSTVEWLSEEKLNNYLDKNLQFTNGVSREKNAFGVPYFLYQDDYYFKIYTIEDKEIPREFSIRVDYFKGELNIEQFGFETSIIGAPYCESEIKSNGTYEYQICNGSVIITNYIGTSQDITIPSEIEGKKVVAIGRASSYQLSGNNNKSFYYKGLKSVVIPDTVKIIGGHAFQWNELTNVTIPNSVIKIGEYAFAESNVKTLTLSNKLTNLEEGVFFRNKINNLSIPTSVETIGAYAFEENELNNLTIPSSVTSIGAYAFNYNYLTTLNIPNTVKQIEKYAFAENLLTSLTIPNSITILSDSVFWDNRLTNVTIPNSVTTIEKYAFYKNKLNSITIPNSVTKIEKEAFYYNEITNAYLPVHLQTYVKNGNGIFLNTGSTLPTMHYQ